ncbi:MAG: hypothetical protein WCU80_06650, partial [Paludibacteraceae bacterium]
MTKWFVFLTILLLQPMVSYSQDDMYITEDEANAEADKIQEELRAQKTKKIITRKSTKSEKDDDYDYA